MEPSNISTLAGKLGITLSAREITDYAPKSDGLSGGVSWLYSLRGKLISCHWAGVAHDCLYARGGTELDRLKADRLFCYAAALSGKVIPGQLEIWLCQAGSTKRARLAIAARNWLAWWLWPFGRLIWRIMRALIMYWAIRCFAGGEKHWKRKAAV
jgi:hypothetical protein